VLLGDLLDLPSISKFKDADLYEDALDREFALGREYIARLRDENPKAQIDFQPANHEDRFPTYIAKNAPRLKRVRGMSVAEQLELEKYRVGVIGPRLYIGGRSFLAKHGTYCGAWSCHKELMSEMTSGLSAHQHTNSMVSASVQGHRPIVWRQFGCLCSLDPRYKRREGAPSSWQHGMAVVEHDKYGVEVEVIPIHRGVAYWRGRRYEA
jgi:hypothetical protein